jgi:hypothetical protein
MNRYTTMQGLRSVFRILKGRELVFVNPTARVHAPSPDFRLYCCFCGSDSVGQHWWVTAEAEHGQGDEAVG